MKTLFTLTLLTCLFRNATTAQLPQNLYLSLSNSAPSDTFGFFDRVPLHLYVKSFIDTPVVMGWLFYRNTLFVKIEWRLENDTTWREYEPVYGKVPGPPAYDYMPISPMQEFNPIKFDLTAFMFLKFQPDLDITRTDYFSFYIRIRNAEKDSLVKYESNPVKIVLHNYRSSPDDHEAFLYLMGTKKPGIFTPCYMENFFYPCVSLDSLDVLTMDTLIRLYPGSLFAAWAHTLLAGYNFMKPIDQPVDQPEIHFGDVVDLKKIDQQLARLRRVKHHVDAALSVNNPDIKRELSFMSLQRPDYFPNWLNNIFYSNFSISHPIPLELVKEFSPVAREK